MDEENKNEKLVDEKDSWFEEEKSDKEEIKVKEFDESPKMEEKSEVEAEKPAEENEPKEEESKDNSVEETKKAESKVKEEAKVEQTQQSSSEAETKVEKTEEPKIEVEKSAPITVNKTTVWKAIAVILAILLIISIYRSGFGFNNDANETKSTDVSVTGALTAIVLNDIRCTTCDTSGLLTQLKTTFPELEIKELDYNSDEGNDIYKESGLQALPAVLFSDDVKESAGFAQIEQFVETKGDYFSLKIGAAFNPNAEICDNEKDDNEDGKVDCDDETCKSTWMCMEKQEVPTVEAFVMSHCPYGTQIEKGLIPVVELLGDKIDFEIKFCDYAMHGKTELDEQTTQYCIQKEQNDKFLPYLKCFLKAGNSAECIEEVEIDKTSVALCEQLTDVEFKITEEFEDKSTWRGNFPLFKVYQEEVDKYGVRGSPTLVINGVTASAGRDAKSLLNAICTGFSIKPEECNTELDAASPSPGFGFEPAAAGTTEATCG